MIEFWFDFASNYSYLSVMRIQREAEALGVTVIWKPFLLGPIFRSLGMSTSPSVLQKEKGAYVWRDMERQCEKYGLAWTKPSTFPRLSLLPARIAMVCTDKNWLGKFSQEVMLLNFAADRDINAADEMCLILERLGVAPREIIEQSNSESTKAALRSRTQHAQALGVFGAPTFFVNGEMYWGNDRLDDALIAASGETN